jgi:hypothetical protein
MYSQRDPQWKSLLLGHGTGTIGQYGCTLSSLATLLHARLLQTNPKLLNDRFKQTGVFGGATKNLIIWSNLEKAYPQFEFVTRKYGNDLRGIQETVAREGATLVEVDGTPIGAPKHWVLSTENGLIDPWPVPAKLLPHSAYTITGWIDYELIAPRFPKEETMSSTLLAYLGATTESNAIARLKEHLGEWQGKCDWGNADGEDRGGYLGADRRAKAQLEHDLKNAKAELEVTENMLKEASELAEKYEAELTRLAERLAECQAGAQTPPSPPEQQTGLPERAKLNGIQRSYTQGIYTITENYSVEQ